MAEVRIDAAERSDLKTQFGPGTEQFYDVPPVSLDSPVDQKENRWQNNKWTQQLGYYKKIPELKIALDTEAEWVTGNGFIADEPTEMLLDTIKGWGKEDFISIIENLRRTSKIGGDAFGQIITDSDGILINLKSLNPETMITITNKQGIIIKYEQTSNIKGKENQRFEPEEIFHLSNNRVGDEIHGISVVDAVEEIILMRNEAMADRRIVMHRNVAPMIVFHMDFDNTAEVAAFKAKMDKAYGTKEIMYIPKGAIVPEVINTANAIVDATSWIESLNDYFYETVGVPKIVIGNSKNFTDASSKMVYLTYEQRVKAAQRYLEMQILAQLNIVIELVKPALLENEVLAAKPTSEERGEEQVEPAAQPNDTTAELEGVR